jgi:hypothetical protein
VTTEQGPGVQTTEAAATQRARERAAVRSRRRGDEVEGGRGVGLADEELECMRTVSVGGGSGGTESAAVAERGHMETGAMGGSGGGWRRFGKTVADFWIHGSDVGQGRRSGKKTVKNQSGCRGVAGGSWQVGSGME